MADAAASVNAPQRVPAPLDVSGPVPRGDEGGSPLTIEAHDRQQIEVQLAHALSATEGEPLDLELFFFVPRAVGVTAANYPRDEFYGDLTSFLRVDLPDLRLDELATGARSPLLLLQHHVETIARGEIPLRPLSVEVKLFGHTFTEAVRDRVRALLAELHDLASSPVEDRWRYLDDVDRFAESARTALGALRRALRRFEPLGRAGPQVVQTLHYTDEYCSLFLDGAIALLARAAQGESALYDGSGFVGRFTQTLGRHARLEAVYRTSLGYLNLTDAPADVEYFAYRQSFLKKAVQQALYVDTRRIESDRFVRNAAGAVAAALAATWALVAQLPAQIQNLPPGLQTFLLGLPIVAYIAKDRIKELTRDWLSRRAKSYDHGSGIAPGSLADVGLAALSGSVKERVKFLDLSQVPPDVLSLRVAKRTVRGAELGGEGVLTYSRRIELHSARRAAPFAEGMALRQIIRLNLRHFLTRLDEPHQPESHYSLTTETFRLVELPKVYHLNLIARVTEGSGKTSCRRWRIVINKEGIVRLDSFA